MQQTVRYMCVRLVPIGAFSMVVYLCLVSPGQLVYNITHSHTEYDADLRRTLTTSGGSPIIPRIIHQTWDSRDIPVDLVPWVQTWKKHNPEWQYWFWTPKEVRELLKDKYPEYLTLYNSYFYNIFRHDIMRYFIMDSFGGFYADMDMDCLKPLDSWIYNHSCLLSHEPYEHPYFGFGRTSANVMNTILACRPNHLYWKRVITSLQSANKAHGTDVQLTTGPLFLEQIIQDYNHSQSAQVYVVTSLDQVTSKLRNTSSITILHPKYLLPTYDITLEDKVRKGCKALHTRDNNLLDVCARIRNSSTNTPGPESFTNHHWSHMFLSQPKWRQKSTRSIFDVVPGVKVYKK